MNMKHALLLLILMSCAACTAVTSKKPVGEKIPTLDPAIWNGKWTGSNGTVQSRIKDAGQGVVELTLTEFEKPDHPEVHDTLIRTVSDQVIANTQDKGDYYFGRVVISQDHLVIFPPDTTVFSKLLEAGTLRGERLKNDKGKLTGSSVLNEFSERDVQALEALAKEKGSSFRLRDLFDADPVLALVRLKSPEKK